jgi:hypothetical protein
MRVLVIGLPLPDPSFDNYTLLSAPSFFDYEALVVEASAVSKAIAEAAAGAGEHETYDRLRVVNGPSGPEAMSLAALVRVRRWETERFLARGGVLVLFAYPEVPVPGVEGLPDCRRYYWLPEHTLGPWEDLLVPGFGSRGAELVDPQHPFAPYVEQFGPRLSFRAHLSPRAESEARVFARSPGGAAVGAELALNGGRLVLLPPVGDLNPTFDRMTLAQTMRACIETALGLRPATGDVPPAGQQEVREHGVP